MSFGLTRPPRVLLLSQETLPLLDGLLAQGETLQNQSKVESGREEPWLLLEGFRRGGKREDKVMRV